MPSYLPAQTTVTLTGDDGSTITLTVDVSAVLTPKPDPEPTPDPEPEPLPTPTVQVTTTADSLSFTWVSDVSPAGGWDVSAAAGSAVATQHVADGLARSATLVGLAPETTYTVTLTSAATTAATAVATTLAAPPPPPPPPPEPEPEPPATVEIGGKPVVIAAPGKLKLDAYRDANDLVIYTQASAVGGKTPANQWGKDVPVAAGKVAAAAATSPITIPSGGFVLSGHYQTGEALAAAATVGADVIVKDASGQVVTIPVSGDPAPVPDPTPAPPPDPTSWPAKMIAAYKKMFNGDPGRFGDYTAAGCNVVFLAFATQNTGPLRLVGYSAQGKASLVADIKAHQAKGGKLSISIGGAGNPINTSNTAQFVADFTAIGADLGVPLDGIDWDLEHDNNATQIVAISKALKDKYGPGFGVTYSVGGVGSQAAIDNRINTGVALRDAGLLTAYSWQLYDTVVDLGTAKWRLQWCLDRGIPKAALTVGMMLGTSQNYWDNNEALTYMRDINATMGLTRTALWTEGWNANDTRWAQDMRAILG